MIPRIAEEVEMIRKLYPDIEVLEVNSLVWVRVPDYKLPSGIGWNKPTVDVALNFPVGYPASPPYGLYIPTDLLFNENKIYTAPQQPSPFLGEWGMFSWAPQDNAWKPTSDSVESINMLNFLRSFYDRFEQGDKEPQP